MLPLHRPSRLMPAARRAAAALALLAAPGALHAQLRPLEPLDWSIYEGANTVVATLGAGVFQRQRASLAGTEGQLLELGAFQALWRTGRVALEASGTLYRVFEDRSVFAPPYGGARAPDGRRRTDAGDYRVSTTVRLTPADRDALATLRFGTRLPTTDNVVGLERDMTDFFALVGGRLRHRGLRIAAETGVGIFGTREAHFEQSDVLAFALEAEHPVAGMVAALSLNGHADGLRGRAVRGNEELAELRLRLRTDGRFWAQAQVVRGLTAFSPAHGLIVGGGLTR
jgi:hypothetical protein